MNELCTEKDVEHTIHYSIYMGIVKILKRLNYIWKKMKNEVKKDLRSYATLINVYGSIEKDFDTSRRLYK